MAVFTVEAALLLWLLHGCEGILLRNVGVPSYAVRGKEVVLSCDYDLENQDLYSVKWYKNGMEFYRYLPRKSKPMTVYARAGVNVDQKRSDEYQVTLTDLSLQSLGRYRCEVSTEAPSFSTVSNYGDMVIVVPPESGPTIHGGKERYRPGDMADVNCTSRNSKPAADLLWFINGEPADSSMLRRYPIENTTHGLHTSTIGLRFKVLREHFSERGDMKLKCTATIATIYWKSNEKSAEGMKQKRGVKQTQREEQTPNFADGLSSTFGTNAALSFSPMLLLQLFPFVILTW